MKKEPVLRILSLVLLIGTLWTPLAQAAQRTSENRVAFLVNNEAVFTKSFQDRLIFTAVSMGMQPVPSVLEKLKPTVLNAMIDEILQRQQATKAGVVLEGKVVENALQEIEKNNGMQPGMLEKTLKAQNVSLETLRAQIRSQLMWIDYIRKMYEPGLVISSQAVENYKKRLERNQQKTQYALLEIVLYVTNIRDEQAVKKQASQIENWLREGAPFIAVARQFSQSPSAMQGGQMGVVTVDDLEPEVAKILSHMEPGSLSPPIRTASGYVILALIDKKKPDSQNNAPLQTDEDIRSILRSENLERLARRELAGLRQRVPVEIRLTIT